MTKKLDMNYMSVHMVTAEMQYECIEFSFLIDKCGNTESFGRCTGKFTKGVFFMSARMKLVNEKLYAVQDWKKAFWNLSVIDSDQAQELLHVM